MTRSPGPNRDRTLLRVALFFLLLLAASAAADLLRGTGGTAWWRGVAETGVLVRDR